jgi:tRNA A37 threonylcarbamoyltransferase TsaD
LGKTDDAVGSFDKVQNILGLPILATALVDKYAQLNPKLSFYKTKVSGLDFSFQV